MEYKLTELTADTIARTQRAWINDLAHVPDFFPGDVYRMIAFAKQHSDYANSEVVSLAYGVFTDDSHVADCIVEVIITREGKKFVKMLDCIVRPSISDKVSKFDQAAVQKLIEIYCSTIIGTIAIGDHHKANAIKVYGRTNPLLTVLTMVSKLLGEHPELKSMFKGTIEGRWLVVKPHQPRKIK